MSATQMTGLLATVGAAFLAQSVACALLWHRVRRLGSRSASADLGPNAGPASSTAAILRTLEARLARLEADAQGGGGGPATEARRQRRHDRRQVAAADGPVLIAVPNLASPRNTTTADAVAEFHRRFEPIWTLADAGATLDEVARQSGYPAGQVELILGLRGPRPTAAALDGPGDRVRGGPDA